MRTADTVITAIKLLDAVDDDRYTVSDALLPWVPRRSPHCSPPGPPLPTASMRYAEIALLLVPVAMAVAWWFGVRGLSRTGVVAVAAALAAMSLLLLWLGEGRSVRGIYVPAQLSGGEIVPGRGQK